MGNVGHKTPNDPGYVPPPGPNDPGYVPPGPNDPTTTTVVTADSIIAQLNTQVAIVNQDTDDVTKSKDLGKLIFEATVALADNPQLPAADQTKLAAWIGNLSADLHVTTPGTTINQYWKPSILAIIAPLLGEITKLMIAIVKQSAKLETSMMQLILSTAETIYQQTIAAGAAKNEQLDAQKAMYVASAVQGFLGGLVALGGIAANMQMSKAANAKIDKQFEDPQTLELPKPGSQRYDEMMDARTKSQNTITTKVSMWTEAFNSFVTGAVNTFNAVETSLQEKGNTDEALANAIVAMQTQLVQIFSNTMQKAGDASKGSTDYFNQFISTFKELAQSVNPHG